MVKIKISVDNVNEKHLDINEVHRTRINKNQKQRFYEYYLSNLQANNERGAGDDCITTVINGTRKMFRGHKVPATSPVQKLGEVWQKLGIVKAINPIKVAGELTDYPKRFNESISQKLIEVTKKEKGTYMFLIGVMDGYHSIIVLLENTSSPSFTYHDQWKMKSFNPSKLDEQLISDSLQGYLYYTTNGIKEPKRLTHIYQYINIDYIDMLKSIESSSI